MRFSVLRGEKPGRRWRRDKRRLAATFSAVLTQPSGGAVLVGGAAKAAALQWKRGRCHACIVQYVSGHDMSQDTKLPAVLGTPISRNRCEGCQVEIQRPCQDLEEGEGGGVHVP